MLPVGHCQVPPPLRPLQAETTVVGSQQGLRCGSICPVTTGQESVVNRCATSPHSVQTSHPRRQGPSTQETILSDHPQHCTVLPRCCLSRVHIMPISAKWKHKSSIHIGFIVFNGGVTTFFAKSVWRPLKKVLWPRCCLMRNIHNQHQNELCLLYNMYFTVVENITNIYHWYVCASRTIINYGINHLLTKHVFSCNLSAIPSRYEYVNGEIMPCNSSNDLHKYLIITAVSIIMFSSQYRSHF